eukprot:TRINITY_DN5494_c0_g1_i1.p1 TRINITY_DN5494_c0_g1~~TRINITY_DN5494_c0_g1_i1.p1  ORF type:complete len:437 (+),score=66.33 TRINITY_DN5494_c0_g1_i1:36-1346(+)
MRLIILYVFCVLCATCLAANSFVDSCLCTTQKPSGIVSDCCCTADTVETQVDRLLPVMDELNSKLPLRYFKINLDAGCPFWNKPEVCAIRACAICECPADEVPVLVRQKDDACVCDMSDYVDRTTDDATDLFSSTGAEHIWAHGGALEDGTYIDLALNPEQYTAYMGPHIWQAIYAENCFPDRDECLETRVFYRVVSGLHASINSHLAYKHGSDGVLAPNVTLYQERVGKYQERIENLYFTYLLVLRAVTRSTSALLNVDLSTGDQHEDAEAKRLLGELLNSNLLQNCPATFDETQLFVGRYAGLREGFRRRFVNISRIMDCVGCERCQLWGKVQTLGVGTALKLLFCDASNADCIPTRQEVVALLHVLRQLAESVSILQHVRSLEAQQQLQRMTSTVVSPTMSMVVVLALLIFIRCCCKCKGHSKGFTLHAPKKD